MTKKLIHYDPAEAGKLHCDACGYDLPERQPFTRDLIGTPCPECGADMLTERDYRDTARIFAVIDWLNKCFGWLGHTKDEAKAHGVSIRHKVHNGVHTICPKGKDQ